MESVQVEATQEAIDTVFRSTQRIFYDLLCDECEKPIKAYSDHRIVAGFGRAMWIVGGNMNPQDKQVNENEAILMRCYRDQGLSIELIAYIFDRSKSTVHNHTSDL